MSFYPPSLPHPIFLALIQEDDFEFLKIDKDEKRNIFEKITV